MANSSRRGLFRGLRQQRTAPRGPFWFSLRRRTGGSASRGRSLGRFEELEDRHLLSVIELGPSDNLALDQPRVAMELLTNYEAGLAAVNNEIHVIETGGTHRVFNRSGSLRTTMESPLTYGVSGLAGSPTSNRLFAIENISIFDIVELNPNTGALMNRFTSPDVPDGGAAGLAFDGTSLFFLNGSGDDTLYQLNPNNGAVLDADPITVGSGDYDGLTALNGKVYILDATNSDIFEFDPATDTITNTLDIDGENSVGSSEVPQRIFRGLASFSGPDVLLSFGVTDPKVLEISPTTGRVNAYRGVSLDSYGPLIYNTFLLDTGANSVLSMASATSELLSPPNEYEIEGTFIETGVSGDHPMDVSATYRFDVAADNGERMVLPDSRILSDARNNFSDFGPWGIVGMPAMVGRVTSLDFTGWRIFDLANIFMKVDFLDEVPEVEPAYDPDNDHRYSVKLDNRISFDPVDSLPPGSPPGSPLPVWADVPFLSTTLINKGITRSENNFLFDTGGQLSALSTQLAFDLGLDTNNNGTLEDEALRFEVIAGVGGETLVPVLAIDEVRVPTEEGVDLAWTNLEWLVLDIIPPDLSLPPDERPPSFDGVFGSDLLTSGWLDTIFSGGGDGYFERVHFDFRDLSLYDADNPRDPNELTYGTLYLDVSPIYDQIVPDGPIEIRGSKWSDLNNDGFWDAGEPGIPNWTIFLDENLNGQRDVGEPFQLTDVDGNYVFTNLQAGTYTVMEEPQAGWEQTYPTTGLYVDPASATSFSGSGTSTASAALDADDTVYQVRIASELVTSSAFTSSGTGGSDELDTEANTLVNMDDFRDDPRFAGVNGSGYSVVVLDTGIDLDHPFFGDDLDGNGIADRIVYQQDFVTGGSADDQNGHGTHVTSIIASSDPNNLGIAPGVNIIALQVLDAAGNGESPYIKTALTWIRDNAETYNIVGVNMSLSDAGNYNTERRWYLNRELKALAEDGIIVVSAAGNAFYDQNSQTGVAYPAADPYSLAIGAVYDTDIGSYSYQGGAVAVSTGADRIAPFSQRHPDLTTVFAPGAAITGAQANYSGADTTIAYHGTSQAAPQVTGMAVLAQQLAEATIGRRLSVDEFAMLVNDSGTAIYDGDDEDDNVTNTGLNFQRADMLALAERILALADRAGHHTVTLTRGQVVEEINFGNHLDAEPTEDFGDVPNGLSYPVKLADDGARHTILAGFYLGAGVDAEWDAAANAAADGDDLIGMPDDEDGVIFTTAIIAGATADVDVLASAPGKLDAWIDFNGDGDWTDAGEQIFNDRQLATAGTNSLSFAVPNAALPGISTYARFRFSSPSSPDLSFGGLAGDGEVEDYLVGIHGIDFGDALHPAYVTDPGQPTYPTLAADGGASHEIVPTGPFLGTIADAEGDGQPNVTATGDDNAGTPDDEDGITLTSLINPGETAYLDIEVTAPALLDAWIDFNADGDWLDPGEQIFASAPLAAGINSRTFEVPGDALLGDTFARFRVSTSGGLSFDGFASNGEVEDYLMTVEPTPLYDWGDAPDDATTPGYPTLAVNQGARHLVVPNFALGLEIDTEPDGRPTTAADGDDTFAAADDDGLISSGALTVGDPAASIEIYVTDTDDLGGFLDAWIDFNQDGQWTVDERIYSGPVAARLNTVTFAIPRDAASGDTYARFRLNSSAAGLDPTGPTDPANDVDGEVEDYRIRLAEPTYYFEEAAQFGAGDDDSGHDLVVDADGNTYVTGGFQGTVDFDPGPASQTLTSAGDEDIFLLKLDADGNLAWVRQFGASGVDRGHALAVSGGTVYLTGQFSGTVTFDPIDGPFTAVGEDAFVVTLDASDGSVAWARQLGGAGSDLANAIAVGPDGSVVTTGQFSDTADFDPSPTGTHDLTSTAASADIFVWKLDALGDFVWATSFGDATDDSGNALAVAADGSVHVSGEFSGTVTFDPGSGPFTAVGQDAFLVKLGPIDGSVTWAAQLGGTGTDVARAIALADDGSVYTAGEFSGTADFDPDATGSYPLTSQGGSADIFISKLDAGGNFLWARGLGYVAADRADDLTVGDDGGLYATGRFGSTVDFDPSAGSVGLVSAGGTDAFLLKLNADGNFTWAERLGGTEDDFGLGIDVASDGAIHATGGFRDSVDFDPGDGQFDLVSAGGTDVFTWRLLPSIAPTDITLDGSLELPENQPIGTLVGNFSTADANRLDTFTYELVSGVGSEDNFAFSIAGNQLLTGIEFDYESKSSHAIRVRSVDSAGLHVEKTFTVTITDAPERLTLDASSWPVGAAVTVLLDGGNVRVVDSATSNDLLTPHPLFDVESVRLTGSDADNTVTIDFSGGNPIPTGGVDFHGNGQSGSPGDTLVLTGGSFTTATFNYTNASDGSIDLDGSVINYTGLEPITSDSLFADAVFNLTSSADRARLEDRGGGNLRLRSQNGSFETTAFAAPTGTLTVNGAGEDDALTIDDLSGSFAGSLQVNGNAGDDSIYVYVPASGVSATLGGGDLAVSGIAAGVNGAGFEQIRVYSPAGSTNLATLQGTDGNDAFTGRSDYSYLKGSGYYAYVAGFRQIDADVATDAGTDLAYLYDTTGYDTLIGTPLDTRFVLGTGIENRAVGFDKVRSYATGGADHAGLTGSTGDDIFLGRSAYSYLQGPGYYDYVSGFATVTAIATGAAAGGNDVAYLYDTSGADTFNGQPLISSMTLAVGPTNAAEGFDKVRAYASGAAVGNDEAYLTGSSGNDTLVSRSTYTYLRGAGYYQSASGFDLVDADAFADAGAGNDIAYLFDSSGSDTFNGLRQTAQMILDGGSGTETLAHGFDRVRGYASDAGDTAYLEGSSGDDTMVAKPDVTYLDGPGFSNYAVDFPYVEANGGYAGGSGNDLAYLYDTSAAYTGGDDTFFGTPGMGRLVLENGVENRAVGFDSVRAYAQSSGAGGDAAYLEGSATRDRFIARADYGYLRGDDYYNYAAGFATVEADVSVAGGGGSDVAYLYDSSGADQLYFNENGVTRFDLNPGPENSAIGFDRIEAYATGATDGNDYAKLYGTSGADTLVAYPRQATMTLSTGVEAIVDGFYYLEAHAFAWDSGNGTDAAVADEGLDRAYLFGSPSRDQFDFGMQVLSKIDPITWIQEIADVTRVTLRDFANSLYSNFAWGFEYVEVDVTAGSDTSNDYATLEDSRFDDLFTGRNTNEGHMTDGDVYELLARGFYHITATTSPEGGTDTAEFTNGPVDYLYNIFGQSGGGLP